MGLDSPNRLERAGKFGLNAQANWLGIDPGRSPRGHFPVQPSHHHVSRLHGSRREALPRSSSLTIVVPANAGTHTARSFRAA